MAAEEKSEVRAPTERALIVAEACAALDSDAQKAREILLDQYPFENVVSTPRNYSLVDCMETFLKDGFIDRYSGQRLVFPGTLRLLSLQLPAEFPFHPHWKMEATHIAYWELFPTIDHIVPVAPGGPDLPSNWVTTSQLRNSQKANWTLDQLGWQLVSPGNLAEWDGLTRWCLRFLEHHPSLKCEPYLRRWTNAARMLGQTS